MELAVPAGKFEGIWRYLRDQMLPWELLEHTEYGISVYITAKLSDAQKLALIAGGATLLSG